MIGHKDNIFMIQRPYVSNGLKRSYHKKIEIMEYTPWDKDPNRYLRISTHIWQKSGWKIKETFSHVKTHSKIIIHNDVVSNKANIDDDVFFESFELAYISKIMLIQSMKEVYMESLKDLKEKMERNIPDIKDHLEQIKEKYSEYLI